MQKDQRQAAVASLPYMNARAVCFDFHLTDSRSFNASIVGVSPDDDNCPLSCDSR
jgi:hypothetical protein